MSKDKEEKGMAMPMTKLNKNVTTSSWKRMAQIAEQSMKKDNYNIDDVRKSLKELRNSY